MQKPSRPQPRPSHLLTGALALLLGCSAGPEDHGAEQSDVAEQAPGAAAGVGPSTTLDLQGEPQFSRLVRLTKGQWDRSVRDILRLAAAPGIAANIQEPVSGTTDFTNNEQVLNVDDRAASDFRVAAEQLASMVGGSSAALARVYPGTDAAGFIATVGRRAYRRPLTSAELTAYGALFERGASTAGVQSPFAKGAATVIRALLQSPYFLYRTELGAAGSPLSGYELAAKLSLWLRGTTPSDELLDAAASGRLDTADGAAALATTMLQEAAARDVMRDFHRELYHLERYSGISKIGVPEFTPEINVEYLESSRLFFDNLFTRGQGVKELLSSTKGFVGRRLAALYGVSAPAQGYEERELGPRRVGYFSQIPFLSLHGLNNEPDSIHRGVSLNLDVLCTLLGPPAANLPPIPALVPGQTNRQRISRLTEGCGGTCHNQQINPLGFAFENFDGMGRYRQVEGTNLPIASNGSFTFLEGVRAFADASALMTLVASSKQAHRCYAKKLASFGLQRDIVVADLPLLDVLTQTSLREGSIKSIIVALVRSDAFRLRAGGRP